jgi:hypothetical protein
MNRHGRRRFRPGPLRFLGIYGQRDATLFAAGFALWAAVNGASLIWTMNAFTRQPAYIVALRMGLNDDLTGWCMIADALLLMFAITRGKPAARSLIVIMTGLVWCFWSAIVGLGAYAADIFSANAAWSLCASFLLMCSAAPHHWHPSNGLPVPIPQEPPDDQHA